MKKAIALILVLCLLAGVCGCGYMESGKMSDASEGATFKSDHWYSTELLEGLLFRNCVITQAFHRSSGGVFSTYIPVCKGCQEKGALCSAILDSETPYLTVFTCECGVRSNIEIKYCL